MNLFYTMPPKNGDTKALTRWCGGLLTELKRVLLRLDDTNILSLSCGKLTGNMNFGNIELSDNSIKIQREDKTVFQLSDDGKNLSFTLSAENNAYYIKLINNKLYIKCAEIIADSAVLPVEE